MLCWGFSLSNLNVIRGFVNFLCRVTICNYHCYLFLDWWCRVVLFSVHIESSAILPLRSLNADLACGKPGAPATAVGGPHHCDVYTTLDIAICPVVGLMPLGGEADGQVFQYGLSISTHKDFHKDNKGGNFHCC